MQVKIKKLHPDAKTPTYGTDGAACFDLYAAGFEEAKDDSVFGTGLSFEIPENHAMIVYSRSGDGFNRGIHLINSVGVIDSDYRGEVKVKFRYTRDVSMPSHIVGDRIAQAMIIPVEQVTFQEVEELSETKRGGNGFGSTGTK